MSVSLIYCLVISPINIYQGPQDQYLYLKIMSNTNTSRMMQCMNQWFLNLQKGIKTTKYWNYRLEEYGIRLINRLLECIYQPLFFNRFLIWVVFSNVIIQIKIRQKICFKIASSPIA